MKKLALIFACVAVMAAPALADDAKVKPTPPPPAEFTMNDCVTILQGLRGLDGYTVVVNQGKPNESTFLQSYKFANATLRADIAHDIAQVQDLPNQVEKIRQQVLLEITNGKAQLDPPDPKSSQAVRDAYEKQVASYNKQLVALGESPCHAQLVHIKAADLRLDVNEIPNTVLAAIDKILDR
jgi:hypothetical protein